MPMDSLAITKWSGKLLNDYREQLVYKEMTNQDYEGEVRYSGAVKVFTAPIPDDAEYTRGSTTIAYQDVNPSEQLIVIDQRRYWGIKTDDLERQLARPDVWNRTLRNGAWRLSKSADSYIAAALIAGCPPDHVLTPRTIGLGANSRAFDLFVEMEKTLENADVPLSDIHAAIPPDLEGFLLLDPRYTSFNTAQAVQYMARKNVGEARNFKVHKTTAVPETSGVFTIIGASTEAMTFAEQMSKLENVPRDKDDFDDRVRSQVVYGGKVLQPRGIVICNVQFASYA